MPFIWATSAHTKQLNRTNPFFMQRSPNLSSDKAFLTIFLHRVCIHDSRKLQITRFCFLGTTFDIDIVNEENSLALSISNSSFSNIRQVGFAYGDEAVGVLKLGSTRPLSNTVLDLKTVSFSDISGAGYVINAKDAPNLKPHTSSLQPIRYIHELVVTNMNFFCFVVDSPQTMTETMQVFGTLQ